MLQGEEDLIAGIHPYADVPWLGRHDVPIAAHREFGGDVEDRDVTLTGRVEYFPAMDMPDLASRVEASLRDAVTMAVGMDYYHDEKKPDFLSR